MESGLETQQKSAHSVGEYGRKQQKSYCKLSTDVETMKMLFTGSAHASLPGGTGFQSPSNSDLWLSRYLRLGYERGSSWQD